MPLLPILGRRPKDLGIHDGRLRPCPKTPNCVCSDCEGKRHGIAPFDFGGRSAEAAWNLAKEAVKSLPRTEVITETDSYLHAESRSRICGFGDDLELHLRREEGIIAVRCAARLGYSDFGANRKRVETLRSILNGAAS